MFCCAALCNYSFIQYGFNQKVHLKTIHDKSYSSKTPEQITSRRMSWHGSLGALLLLGQLGPDLVRELVQVFVHYTACRTSWCRRDCSPVKEERAKVSISGLVSPQAPNTTHLYQERRQFISLRCIFQGRGIHYKVCTDFNCDRQGQSGQAGN